MILNRSFYNKIFFLKAAVYRYRAKRLLNDTTETRKLFKFFKLHRIEWPGRPYDYSPRLKRVPVFTGDKNLLSKWVEAKSLETVCPTNAIKVTKEAILIDHRGCIACGLCWEFAPEGLLEVPAEMTKFHN